MFGKVKGWICFALTALAVSAFGNFEEYAFNALGSRTQFWNAERKSMTFGVDAQGRVTAITNAIGKVIRYRRDVNGNIANRIDSLNRSAGYVFDGIDRMVRVDYPDATQAVFDHDSNGNILLSSNENAQVTFAYDEMNRLSGTASLLRSLSSFAVTNSYDLNGNRTNIV